MSNHLRSITNHILSVFGREIVPDYIGHWSIHNGEIHRSLIQVGWRIGKKGELSSTAFDRFFHENGMTDKFKRILRSMSGKVLH